VNAPKPVKFKLQKPTKLPVEPLSTLDSLASVIITYISFEVYEAAVAAYKTHCDIELP
jgi:hypothetical protein